MASVKTTSLSVILPCFNPAKNIYGDILSGFSFIKARYPDAELIVVNDGSTRNFSVQQAEAVFQSHPEINLISYTENVGKGYALREGVKAAKGECLIYTDVDFPYTTESFFRIADALDSGQCDIAMGIRPEEYYRHLPQSRVRISKFLRLMIRKFLNIPTDDTQCGLKGFNAKGKEIFLQTTINRYLFDLEFIFLAARKKLSIRTIRVDLRPEVTLSSMRWKILMQEFANFLSIFARSFF